jgi:hypothetical protein
LQYKNGFLSHENKSVLFQKLFDPVVYLHLHVSVTSVYCPIYGQFYTQQASRIDYLSHSLVYT